jgi:hypothetical protein
MHPGNQDAAYDKACQHFGKGVTLLPYMGESFLRQVHDRTLWRIALTRSKFLPMTLLWFVRVRLAMKPYQVRQKLS